MNKDEQEISREAIDKLKAFEVEFKPLIRGLSDQIRSSIDEFTDRLNAILSEESISADEFHGYDGGYTRNPFYNELAQFGTVIDSVMPRSVNLEPVFTSGKIDFWEPSNC